MHPANDEEPAPAMRSIERLEADLGTLRQAVGLAPPFGREEIWAHLVFAACGAVTLVWALLPTGLPAQWGAVPLILCVVGYVTWMRARYRHDSGRSPMRRHEYTSGMAAGVVVVASAVIYRVWATRLGLSLTIMGSAAMFFFGLALLVVLLRDRNRLPDLGIALPLMACGLLIPFCPVSPWVILGATFLVAGVSTAALTAHCLKDTAADHVAD